MYIVMYIVMYIGMCMYIYIYIYTRIHLMYISTHDEVVGGFSMTAPGVALNQRYDRAYIYIISYYIILNCIYYIMFYFILLYYITCF